MVPCPSELGLKACLLNSEELLYGQEIVGPDILWSDSPADALGLTMAGNNCPDQIALPAGPQALDYTSQIPGRSPFKRKIVDEDLDIPIGLPPSIFSPDALETPKGEQFL